MVTCKNVLNYLEIQFFIDKIEQRKIVEKFVLGLIIYCMEIALGWPS